MLSNNDVMIMIIPPASLLEVFVELKQVSSQWDNAFVYSLKFSQIYRNNILLLV